MIPQSFKCWLNTFTTVAWIVFKDIMLLNVHIVIFMCHDVSGGIYTAIQAGFIGICY